MSDSCKLCKYMLADTHGTGRNSYYCVNQDSSEFGKKALSGCDAYERFNPRPDMSFKDALEQIVMYPYGAYPDHWYLFGKEGETSRPFMCISFENNKQMLEFKDAYLRCFDELMRLKREAGDFKEGEQDETT